MDNTHTINEDIQPLVPPATETTQIGIMNIVNPRSTWRHWKNIIVLGLAFQLVFTVYLSMQNLVSTIYEIAGLGVISLSCGYSMLVLSCLIAPAAIKYLSCKWTMVVAFTGQFFNTACNLYPSFYTILPIAMLNGILSAFMWTAQGAYTVTIATDYADITKTELNTILSRFNAIGNFMFQFSQIWGNLISSAVLHNHVNGSNHFTDSSHNNSVRECGFHYCNLQASNITSTNHSYKNNTHDNSNATKHEYNSTEFYILIGIYLGINIIAVIIAACFVDGVTPVHHTTEGQGHRRIWDVLLSTIKLHGNSRIILLLPFFLYNGLEQGFLFTEYTAVSQDIK